MFDAMTTNFRYPLTRRPRFYRAGELAFPLPKAWFERYDERALTCALICNRKLFGACYLDLVPQLYRSMGKRSGVMIQPLVPTTLIIPGEKFPGDIDLLVIPYDDDELLLSETLAVEIKVVRARYLKQGKAPNEFGFSQASAALSLGFPYVAVMHLIVSDVSPKDQWRRVAVAKVLDADTGQIGSLTQMDRDLLPMDLIDRSFGRLVSNCPNNSIGLVSAYIEYERNGHWMPNVRKAIKNTHLPESLMVALARYYERQFSEFFDTPTYQHDA